MGQKFTNSLYRLSTGFSSLHFFNVRIVHLYESEMEKEKTKFDQQQLCY